MLMIVMKEGDSESEMRKWSHQTEKITNPSFAFGGEKLAPTVAPFHLSRHCERDNKQILRAFGSE